MSRWLMWEKQSFPQIALTDTNFQLHIYVNPFYFTLN